MIDSSLDSTETTTPSEKENHDEDHEVEEEEEEEDHPQEGKEQHDPHHHDNPLHPHTSAEVDHEAEEEEEEEGVQHDDDPHHHPSSANANEDAWCCNNSALTHHSTNSMVSFGSCEIRTYNQIVGDHPCCVDGMPIQLGWDYNHEGSIDIDHYEDMKDSGGTCTEALFMMQKMTVVNINDDHDAAASASTPHHHDDHDQDPNHDHPIGVVHLPTAGSGGVPLVTVAPASLASSSSSYSLRLSPEERKEMLIKQMHTHSTFQSERDLMRECRRLNRYKGRSSWCSSGSSSHKAFMKKNKLFFADGPPTYTPSSTSTN